MEKLDKKSAQERIKKLKTSIEKYRYAYHVLDKSLVPDSVNDSLKHELQQLEEQFPDLVTPDSPTQRVGGEPLSKFQKVSHRYPMYSMIDAFSFEELEEWKKRLVKMGGAVRGYFCMVKLDGLAIELEYENGLLKIASTRGDGKTGEDVTQNVKTINSVPLKLRAGAGQLPNNLIARGEVYYKEEDFEAVNRELRKQGKPAMVNPRNGAAGTVRQLDPKITAARRLSFYAWDLMADNLKLKTQKEKSDLLKELGFPTESNSQKIKSLAGIKRYFAEISHKREKLGYWIDGTVVRVDDCRLFEKLGAVGKAQRGLIAWKFAAAEVTTILRDIVVQVGRTGVLTPVAILQPVQVGGTTVSRATLHNQGEIERKDIRIDDTVVVRKAGDIIPEVVKPLAQLRPKNAKKFAMVKKCPVCNSPIQHIGALDFCAGKKCFTQSKRQVVHFVSKGALDIDGLGPKIIEQLLNEGLIKDETDLFELTEGDVKPLERFAEKSAENLVMSIENAKKVELNRFIFALGIRHVGATLANDLANHFESLEKLEHCTIDELNEVYGMGEIIAQSIVDYFSAKNNQSKVKKLLKFIKLKNPIRKKQTLAGKTFVITGSLESLTREEAEQKIRDLGGRASSSVSKETDYVVVGTEPGSKAEKAKKLNLKIISENQLMKMI